MALKFFRISVQDTSREGELNAFLSAHRVLSVERRFVELGENSFWALCVDYLPAMAGDGCMSPGRKGRIDYRDALSPQDFSVFAKLRELRKELAAAEAVPVYNLRLAAAPTGMEVPAGTGRIPSRPCDGKPTAVAPRGSSRGEPARGRVFTSGRAFLLVQANPTSTRRQPHALPLRPDLRPLLHVRRRRRLLRSRVPACDRERHRGGIGHLRRPPAAPAHALLLPLPTQHRHRLPQPLLSRRNVAPVS